MERFKSMARKVNYGMLGVETGVIAAGALLGLPAVAMLGTSMLVIDAPTSLAMDHYLKPKK